MIRPRFDANWSKILASAIKGARSFARDAVVFSGVNSTVPRALSSAPFPLLRVACVDFCVELLLSSLTRTCPLPTVTPLMLSLVSSGTAAAALATNASGSNGGTRTSCKRFNLLYTLPRANTSSWHASATSRIAIGRPFCRAATYTAAPTNNVVQSPSPHLPSLARTTSCLASAAESLLSLNCCAAKSTAREMFARCVLASSRNMARVTPGVAPGAIARLCRAAAKCCPRVSPS